MKSHLKKPFKITKNHTLTLFNLLTFLYNHGHKVYKISFFQL